MTKQQAQIALDNAYAQADLELAGKGKVNGKTLRRIRTLRKKLGL
jgi:hypothetical protein